MTYKFSSIRSYLFVIHLDEDQNFSSVLPPLILHHEPLVEIAFYNIRKLNLCSKTGISKTAWVNAWLEVCFLFREQKYIWSIGHFQQDKTLVEVFMIYEAMSWWLGHRFIKPLILGSKPWGRLPHSSILWVSRNYWLKESTHCDSAAYS